MCSGAEGSGGSWSITDRLDLGCWEVQCWRVSSGASVPAVGDALEPAGRGGDWLGKAGECPSPQPCSGCN